MKKLFENWRRFIKEEPHRLVEEDAAKLMPHTPPSDKYVTAAAAYTQSLPPELIEFFEKERRRMIQDYSSGRGARNIQNHLINFFQRRQKDLEASMSDERWHPLSPAMKEYRKIYESLKNGTAYKQYFKDIIIQGLSAVKVTYYDTLDQFASALKTDPEHASGTTAFYQHREKAVGFSPGMSRGPRSRNHRARMTITHELEHAVSHFFQDAAHQLLIKTLYIGPTDSYNRISRDIRNISFTQAGKLGKILDPEKIKQASPTDRTAAYRDRPEEQRAFIKSWTSTFKEDIKPETIKALCELLGWRRRISDPQYVPAHRREEVMRKWISEFKKTAKIFPELDALLPNLKSGRENWMIMEYINCKDFAATATALNTLAKAQTRKTSIPAE